MQIRKSKAGTQHDTAIQAMGHRPWKNRGMYEQEEGEVETETVGNDALDC